MSSQLQADAAVLQERDGFTGTGWTKVLAPAKVNLHLAIGGRREDGYHDAVSIMHALALHDVVYLRCAPPQREGDVQAAQSVWAAQAAQASIHMVGCGDVQAPDVEPAKNIAVRAVHTLADALGERLPAGAPRSFDIRIEKNIPAQAGLGGGSSDAAAVLAGLSRLWGIDPADEALEAAARALGADVAFFLRGGCAYLDGVGDRFSHALAPRHETVILVKPEGGVSTAAAYAAFDAAPIAVDAAAAAHVREIRNAGEIALFNNLAPAAETLMPELGEIRRWLEAQPGVREALLSGSGSATFAICASFDDACRIAAAARARGLWARTTAFSPIRAAVC